MQTIRITPRKEKQGTSKRFQRKMTLRDRPSVMTQEALSPRLWYLVSSPELTRGVHGAYDTLKTDGLLPLNRKLTYSRQRSVISIINEEHSPMYFRIITRLAFSNKAAQ